MCMLDEKNPFDKADENLELEKISCEFEGFYLLLSVHFRVHQPFICALVMSVVQYYWKYLVYTLCNPIIYHF